MIIWYVLASPVTGSAIVLLGSWIKCRKVPRMQSTLVMGRVLGMYEEMHGLVSSTPGFLDLALLSF
jgi:hypothetical protein